MSNNFHIVIDGKKVSATLGATILETAFSAALYIPALCYHPSLPNWTATERMRKEKVYRDIIIQTTHFPKSDSDELFEPCNLCLVEIDGFAQLQRACSTVVAEEMSIHTNTEWVRKARQDALAKILANHPHACLVCPQREGCAREPCSLNVPPDERCCIKFGNCELQKVAEYIGISPATPRYVAKKLPLLDKEPLIIRNYNLCVGCGRCIRICDQRGIGALGYVLISGKVCVGTTDENLAMSGCKFCGCCIEVCPTGALIDRDFPLGHEKELLPCKYKCPLELDVPAINSLIAARNFADAAKLICLSTPFPNTLARACRHVCELFCRRGKLNDAIAICALKRFVLENVSELPKPRQKRENTGKKVAIIGAGPAGLCCAYYLALAGHSVSVYDEKKEPGGTLCIIPGYRLPAPVLQKDINAIFELKNIVFVGNTRIGKDTELDDILQSYDAVFVATGATRSKNLAIDGTNLTGVHWGLEFLTAVKAGLKFQLGRVVVIGGGNVAIDIARTARRLGAIEVNLVCLEKTEEMPAYDWEIKNAIEEGIVISNCWGPNRILSSDGKRVNGVEFVKCLSVFDEMKRFNPRYDKTTMKVLSADTVIFAIGQSTDSSFLPASVVSQNGLIKTSGAKSTHPKLFAGGEVVSGPSSIVDAIAAGKRAAAEINNFLGFSTDIDVQVPEYPKDLRTISEPGFAYRKRRAQKIPTPEERIRTFEEETSGFDETNAVEEARRCLQCSLRFTLKPPVLPPERLLLFNEEIIRKAPTSEGVFLLIDEKKEIVYIAGVPNLQQRLKTELMGRKDVKYFLYEEDKMYTKRESELLQQFLQKHGRMPRYNDDLSELF